jgi:hypothetical protein
MYSRGTLDEKESPITCLDIAPETSG